MLTIVEPQPVFVFGSLVGDNITVLPGLFENHIMPECIGDLNVSFCVDDLRSSWGGTGGNIGYNLQLLGGHPVIVSAIGKNGGAYLRHLQSHGINTDYIYFDEDLESAICFIVTDQNNKQINIYYPGPTAKAANIMIRNIKEVKEARFAIISPSTKELMLKQAIECDSLGLKIIFDPRQQTTTFKEDELMRIIKQSKFIFGNKYEMEFIEERSGWSRKTILYMGKTIITTYGKDGSLIETKLENKPIERIKLPACKDVKVKDPTGAGDAYRAGFILGLTRGYARRICGQLGSVAASFAVEALGAQGHSLDRNNFTKRYKDNYGELPFSLAVEWDTPIIFSQT